MRLLTTLLFFLVPVLGVWSFWIAPEHGWWFPPEVSSYGQDIDFLFYVILWMVGITFVATEVLLVWCILRWGRGEKATTKAGFVHGNHTLEMVWTAVPALLLLFVAFSQMEAWADVKFKDNFPKEGRFTVERPIAEVYASQFDWRFRYPDEQGNFTGADIIEKPFEFVVPVGEPVTFILKSRDVLHSFFVPNFRLKQDAVPGMEIPVWFQADEVGDYDLICAELCGWGHYKMAGRVRVLPAAEYDAWLAAEREALYANGTEDMEDGE
jgi:cytochrome c oxidase subunit II